ncbi:hypothetical protein STEG23_029198 [Scotinomys teguina]
MEEDQSKGTIDFKILILSMLIIKLIVSPPLRQQGGHDTALPSRPGEEHTTCFPGLKSRPPCCLPLVDPAGLRRHRTRQPESTTGFDPELRTTLLAPPIRSAALAKTQEPSLDYCFAKRDRKKKKEGSSWAANMAASSAGGSSSATGARPGVGGSSGSGAMSGNTRTSGKVIRKDEDEWKEFEQKEVNYSGLRVQAMQINEKEDYDNEKREDPGDNWEEGEGGSGVEKSSGPWNKTALVQAPPAPITVTETPEQAMPSSVYRLPGAWLTTTRKTPQGPPEIYSDTQSPSLQSTAKHVESRNRFAAVGLSIAYAFMGTSNFLRLDCSF